MSPCQPIKLSDLDKSRMKHGGLLNKYFCKKNSHYANMSVQYTAIFHGCKNDNFQMIFFLFFLIFAQNIDCGYTLEPPQRGGSNEYPQSMFWSKNKKNMYTRVNPTFSI